MADGTDADVRAAEEPDPAALAGFVRDLVARTRDRLVAEDAGVREGHGPEPIHQARVATRRLRADLRTLRPLLRRDEIDPVRDELRWLGGHLGGLRDAQVLRDHLQELAGTLDGIDPWASATIWNRLDATCASERDRLLDAISGERYVSLIERLDRLATDPPFRPGVDVDARARPVIERQTRTAWRKARRTARRLDDASTDEELHELRKQVKRARYAAQAARGAGADTKAFAKGLRAVQDHLGELHDAAVAMAWLHDSSRELDPAAAFLAGRLHESADARRLELRASWREPWDAVPKLR